MRYIFRLYQNRDEDGSDVWVEADSEEEAEDKIRNEYWGIDYLYLLKVEK